MIAALVGPTASGKTDAAVELARRLDGEILVADSMTVYRGMDVGTAKPPPAERNEVPHHLLDLADPGEPFDVATFQARAREAIAGIRERSRLPLLVGGSGLYYRAVVDDLRFPGRDPGLRALLETEAVAIGAGRLHERLASFDPEAAAKIEPANARRTVRALEVAAVTGRRFSSFSEDWERYPEGRVLAAGVRLAPDPLRRRIRERAERMFAEGLLSEVEGLLAGGFRRALTAAQAIGYREAVEHLDGRLSMEEALEATVRRTRALARRQMAWFRRDRRVRWFDAGPEGAPGIIDELEAHFG